MHKNATDMTEGSIRKLLIAYAVPLLLGNLIQQWIGAKYLALLFIQDEDAVRNGIQFVRYIAPFKIFSSFNQICAGSLRGAGNSRGPMFILLFSLVFWRQLYLHIITQFTSALYPVGFVYPIG